MGETMTWIIIAVSVTILVMELLVVTEAETTYNGRTAEEWFDAYFEVNHERGLARERENAYLEALDKISQLLDMTTELPSPDWWGRPLMEKYVDDAVEFAEDQCYEC